MHGEAVKCSTLLYSIKVLCLTAYCVCISVTVNTTGLTRIKTITVLWRLEINVTTVALKWRKIINVPVTVLMILVIY